MTAPPAGEQNNSITPNFAVTPPSTGLEGDPGQALLLITQLSKPDIRFATVVELIGSDARITAKLIEMANCAKFGTSRPIEDVQYAILVLGLEAVANVSLSIVAGRVFDYVEGTHQEFRKTIYLRSY